MARTGLELGSGALSNVTSNIIGPVPVATTWYLTKLDLVNTHGADVDVTLYVDQGPGARSWKRFTLDASGGSAEIIADDRALVLEAGGVVRALASVSNVVDFIACGVQET